MRVARLSAHIHPVVHAAGTLLLPLKALNTSSVARVAAMGAAPPVISLPYVAMSGEIPSRPQAEAAPQRSRPLNTSSAMSGMRRERHTWGYKRRAGKQSSELLEE